MAKYQGIGQNETSRYLPGYNRKIAGTGIASGIPTPNLSGYQRASVDTLHGGSAQGLDDLMKGVAGLAQTIGDIVNKRNIRDDEVKVHELLRNRSVEVTATRSGAGADNLLQDEEEWLAEQREIFIEESNLFEGGASNIFDAAALGYKDKIGAFMVQQMKVADEESKKGALLSYQRDLAASKPGVFDGYLAYTENVDTLYTPGSYEHQKALMGGLNDYIDNSLALDPRATVAWFNKNKDQMVQLLGNKFDDANKAVTVAHDRMLAKAQAAIKAKDAANFKAAKTDIYGKGGAIHSDVGDFAALQQGIGKLSQLYGSDIKGLGKASKELVSATLEAWAQRDPDLSMAMLQDPEMLLNTIGPENAELITDFRKSAEDAIKTRNSAQSLQDEKDVAATKAAEAGLANDVLGGDGFKNEDGSYEKIPQDRSTFVRMWMERGGSSTGATKTWSTLHGSNEPLASDIQAYSSFAKQAGTGRLDIDSMQAAAKKGLLSNSDVKALISTNKTVVEEAGRQAGLPEASKYLYGSLVGPITLGVPVSPNQHMIAAQVQAAFIKEVNSMPDMAAKIAACDVNNSDSLINRMINSNKETMQQAFDPNSTRTANLSPIGTPQKLDGEDIRAYNKRMGY